MRERSFFNPSAGIRHATDTAGSIGPRGSSDASAPHSLFVDLSAKARSTHISPRVLQTLLRVVEAALVVAVSLVTFEGYVSPSTAGELVLYLVASVIGAALVYAIFATSRLYRVSVLRTIPTQLPRLFFGWTIAFSLMTVIAFFSKIGPEFSRVWFVSWFVFGAMAILALRIVVANLVRAWSRDGRLNKRTVIIGGSEAGVTLIRQLEQATDTDVRICGVFDDRGDDRVGTTIAGYPKLGTVDDLIRFARKTRVDMLIVTLPLTAENRLLEIFKKLWVLPVDIRLAAHANSLRFRPRAYSFVANVPVMDISDRPIGEWDSFTKAAFDRVVGALALIALSPLMALTAIAIRLDSKGPVLFRQNRYGFNNELIKIYKFRSMYAEMSDAAASRLVTRDDPRVTRVGRFIRKTSLDELPQLFNVLNGSLSLVGPRPHALQAKAADQLYHDVVDGYFARHKVKPGITGWAQVNGWRGETDTAEKIQKRVEHDLYYIENWSILFDSYILLRTPLALFQGENAY